MSIISAKSCKISYKNRIAGHSLGATLATHAAIHLAHMGIKIQYLYVFGSYRMGDVKFTKWFEHNMR